MGMSRVVWLAAGAAFLARFPSLLWPLRPDEAGFLLVARAWQPEADSVYGRYFVDRPPPIIWLIQAADAVGGAYTHRLFAAVGCALLVLAAGAASREITRRAGVLDPVVVRRLTGSIAIATAGLVSNAQIDAAGAKGELFGIPVVMASVWLSLRAARRISARDAFWAGLLAMLAVGLKQSIVGGLVFGGVLLLGSALARQLPWRDTARCALAAIAGALVPVAVVVGWALAVGVRLETLWYTSVSFRADANRTIDAQASEGASGRIWLLLLVFVGVGMLALLVCFLARFATLFRLDGVASVAVLAMLAVDLAAVAISGSYWKPYLYVPIPGFALALALLLASDRVRGTRLTANAWAIRFVVASTVVSLIGWTGAWAIGRVPVEVRTGEALDAVGRPGDRVLVYGGRADIQWATHASSPYPYLWSLPMRTLDPRLDELRSVLTGSNPPTWFIEAVYLDTWSEFGTLPIQSSLIRKYEFVETACDRYRIYRLNTVDPVTLDVDCTTPYRTIWGK